MAIECDIDAKFRCVACGEVVRIGEVDNHHCKEINLKRRLAREKRFEREERSEPNREYGDRLEDGFGAESMDDKERK